MKVITPENFSEFTSSPIALLYCWHEECTPCKPLTPQLEEISEDPAYDAITFGKLNTRDHPDITEQLSISGVPQLLVFASGEYTSKIRPVVSALRSDLSVVIENNGVFKHVFKSSSGPPKL